MSSPFVAEIRIFACQFAPKGWAQCNGQLLPLSQNTALFALLGTMYGGDGKSTFALPNMQGNVAIGQGQGPGLSLYDIGAEGGTPSITLLESEMPLHTHNAMVSGRPVVENDAAAMYWGTSTVNVYSNSNQGLGQLALQALTPTGGSLPHNNMQPYLTLLYCIAMQGVFPPRG